MEWNRQSAHQLYAVIPREMRATQYPRHRWDYPAKTSSRAMTGRGSTTVNRSYFTGTRASGAGTRRSAPAKVRRRSGASVANAPAGGLGRFSAPLECRTGVPLPEFAPTLVGLAPPAPAMSRSFPPSNAMSRFEIHEIEEAGGWAWLRTSAAGRTKILSAAIEVEKGNNELFAFRENRACKIAADVRIGPRAAVCTMLASPPLCLR